MASNNEAIVEELEALEAIMMDEVTVLTGDSGVPYGVEVVVVPATAQRLEEQHVRVTLSLTLPLDYPDAPPAIALRNPRGVDDDVLEKIQEESRRKCDEFLGCPVIYELIEVVRDNLTANNTPSCPCAICLHHFTDCDVFTKTPCFHYFHSYCLGRYVDNCEVEAAAEESEPQPSWMTRERKQLMCPVCRDPIQQQLDCVSLLGAPPPEAEDTIPQFSADDPQLVALQRKMAHLYLAQKQRGGIIDLEEEKNKFLLSSDRVESCERLDEDEVEVMRVSVSECRIDHPTQDPTLRSRGGGRMSHQRPQHNKTYGGGGGGYVRGLWRNSDGGDGRQWSTGHGGGRGASRSRGRGGSRGGIHHSRIIQDTKEFSQVIENGCKGPGKQGSRYDNYPPTSNEPTRGPGKQVGGKYDTCSPNDFGGKGQGRQVGGRYDTCSLAPNEVGAGGGGGRKGPKGRQRYGAGRGRGRGPPQTLTPSSQHDSSQDWS